MSEASVINNQRRQGEEQLELPPGFRFHPTDEEVVSHYLIPKALNRLFTCLVVADVDLNKCEPWELPGKAKKRGEENEWYFFCHKDRKYPTGTRTNRATATGYWKATGKDKEIFRGRGVLVGMKKTLVFYLGRAPRGEKTPWVMHEYRMEGKLPPDLPRAAKDEWAVCRVINKDLAAKPGQQPAAAGMKRSDSLDYLLHITDLPPLTSSGSGEIAAGMSISGGYQYQQLAPPPLAELQNYYFSLPVPAVNNAIRRTTEDMAAGSSMYPPELVDDLYSDGFVDCSNMWKF